MSDKNQKTLDKRTYGRYVDKGLVKSSDVEAHIKGLPDDAANAVWVELDLDEAELSHSDTAEGSDESESDVNGLDAASANDTGEEGA